MKAFLKIGFVCGVTLLAWFNIPAAIVAVVATILVALHDKASGLIEISFGPLKAKLEREITQAERLVEQLKSFAALQSRVLLSAGVRTGRFSDETDWLYQHQQAMQRDLRAMGVAEEDLAAARAEFVEYAVRDAAQMAMGSGQIPSVGGTMLQSEWRAALDDPCNGGAERIEKFLNDHGLMNHERKLRIDDMRWMIEHGDVRDAAQFRRTLIPVPWD